MLQPRLLGILAAVTVFAPPIGSNSLLADQESMPSVEESIRIPAATELELETESESDQEDQLWLISTRRITPFARCADLDNPGFSVMQLSCRGRATKKTFDEYRSTLRSDRPAVVYVHGNRMDPENVIQRGLTVYRRIRRCRRPAQPVNWVMLSWPSEKEGILVHDFRRKLVRTDAQSLYLAWILRHHVQSQTPTAIIGYSFGARIVIGSLHALGGGRIAGRTLPGEPVKGYRFDVGLLAPAVKSDSMGPRGIHRMATNNLDELLILYNRRDAVLKRFWLLERVRGVTALGYSGPTSFAARSDGSRIVVRSRDCSPTLGIHHAELEYYDPPCNAGRELASLINDVFTEH